jgi:predicted membrane-bound spermidine synthase
VGNNVYRKRIGVIGRFKGLFEPQLVAREHSPINGEILIKQFIREIYFEVGGSVQVGGFANRRCVKVLKILNKEFPGFRPARALMLGFGGGNMAHHLLRKFHDLTIQGIELDPLMIKLGHLYGMSKPNPQIRVRISDAFLWLERNRRQFDFIFVDLYQGFAIPSPVASQKFLTQLARALDPQGVAVINFYQDDEVHNGLERLTMNAKLVFSRVAIKQILVNSVFFLRH